MVSKLSMGKCSAATTAYALGIRESKNYKGSEIQCLRVLRSQFLTGTFGSSMDQHSLSRTQTYLDKITQVCQEIRNMGLNKNKIAVRNPTAWANGTTPEVVPAKTNKIFNLGLHSPGNSQPPEDTSGACGPDCLLSKDNSAANQICTHNNPGRHDVLHHAPSSPPDGTPQLSPPAPSSLSRIPPASPASTSSSTTVEDSEGLPSDSMVDTFWREKVTESRRMSEGGE